MIARYGFWIAALTLIGSVTLHAEDKKVSADPQVYLEQLQARLEHTARRANQPTSGSSSVIGLRGSKQEPLSKQLYWKGQQGPEPVNLEEVKAFRAAVEQARAGQTSEAITALKVFQIKYPGSALRPDVEETMRILNSAGAPNAATESSPEKTS